MPSEKMQIKIANTLDILCTEYPNLFSKTEPKPIALNFRQKVRDYLKEKYNITNYVLNGTIFRYARESKLYLNSILESEYRFNEDGSQAEKITEADKEFTKQCIYDLDNPKPKKPKIPPPPPKPKKVKPPVEPKAKVVKEKKVDKNKHPVNVKNKTPQTKPLRPNTPTTIKNENGYKRPKEEVKPKVETIIRVKRKFTMEAH